MKSLTVCVTGVGGGGNGEQLLKSLRLAETAYRIVGTDMTPLSTGLAMADIPCILPPASDPSYMDELLSLCRKHDACALLPGSEPELSVISKNRHTIIDAGIFLPLNPPDVISMCMDKLQMFATLAGEKVEVPWFRRVQSENDIADFPQFPVVYKPSTGSGGSANTFIVQNKDEARWFARHLLSLYPEFIAQEYVGTPEDEYTVGVLSDMDGNFINSIAVRRFVLSALGSRIKLPNRTGRDELGKQLVISSGISQGEIGRFPDVTGPCEAIAELLGSRGPFNIQCRFVNGKVYVFEINPRFSGTSSLRALAGFNEPDILIRRHVLGEETAPRFPYKEGVIMRSLKENFVNTTTGL